MRHPAGTPGAKAAPPGAATAQPDLRTGYGLACPKCGQARRLKIVVSSDASITAEGIGNDDHLFWDDDSRCWCPACEFSATVAAFTVPETPAEANAAGLCDALIETLRMALDALNTAPRFRVGATDSYATASRVSAVLAKTKGDAQ